MKREWRDSAHHDPEIRQFVENIADYSTKEIEINNNALSVFVSEIKNICGGDYNLVQFMNRYCNYIRPSSKWEVYKYFG